MAMRIDSQLGGAGAVSGLVGQFPQPQATPADPSALKGMAQRLSVLAHRIDTARTSIGSAADRTFGARPTSGSNSEAGAGKGVQLVPKCTLDELNERIDGLLVLADQLHDQISRFDNL